MISLIFQAYSNDSPFSIDIPLIFKKNQGLQLAQENLDRTKKECLSAQARRARNRGTLPQKSSNLWWFGDLPI